MSFDEELKAARKHIGLSQKGLAEKLNVTPSMIAQYESKKRKPKKETLSKIAEALNVGYAYDEFGEPYFYSFKDTLESKVEEHIKRIYSDDNINPKLKQIYIDEEKRHQEMLIQKHLERYNLLNEAGKSMVHDFIDILLERPSFVLKHSKFSESSKQGHTQRPDNTEE